MTLQHLVFQTIETIFFVSHCWCLQNSCSLFVDRLLLVFNHGVPRYVGLVPNAKTQRDYLEKKGWTKRDKNCNFCGKQEQNLQVILWQVGAFAPQLRNVKLFSPNYPFRSLTLWFLICCNESFWTCRRPHHPSPRTNLKIHSISCNWKNWVSSV